MKNMLITPIILSLFMLFSLFPTELMAQTPQRISYQAIVRDNSNQLMINHGVGVRITILQNAPDGNEVFREIYNPNPQTNSNGLLTLEIGSGLTTLGDFSSIDWSTGLYFIKTEIDPTGGTNYVITGTTKLLAVPYALHAATAETLTGTIAETDPRWAGDAGLTSDIHRTGSVGIGVETPTALLHINGTGTAEGNVLFSGTQKTSPGNPPASGFGTRMMWYPDKAAFRAGRVVGTQWDKDSIGNHSTAFGYNTKAIGSSSTAMGHAAIAAGDYSTAMGFGATASAKDAVAMGFLTIASGNTSTAIGVLTTASGSASIAMGTQTIAPSSNETVIGRYNTIYTPASTSAWNLSDRLFVIGRGTSSEDRLNALTILKNGMTGLGTDTPTALLHTHGTGTGEGNVLFTGTQKSSPGNPPASGFGTRMMWYPDKAAFRAGSVTGAHWDKENIGTYSMAFGIGTVAKGSGSTAMGYFTTASGFNSTAMGAGTTASGDYSTVMGLGTTAPSAFETVIGTNNTIYNPANTTEWSENDRLFVIGRGQSITTRLNALTILKNGNTGIGTDTPTALLHTDGIGAGEGNILFAGSFKGTPGNPPVSGAGTRMMWYPDKAAFRAGRVSGTEWDMNNIGGSSVALGVNVTASGTNSVALGNNASASGGSSVALGSSTIASGVGSTAMGSSTTASGISSTAIGSGSIATGISSTAMGRNARAASNYSFAINLDNNIGPNVAANNFRISGATAIGGNVAWTNHSDRRLKKEIVAIASENNLSKILRLNAVRYRWIEHDQLLNLGFIAQDVLDIVPESVRYDELNDIYSMEYTALIPLLVEGMKEQQGIIENQQNELKNIKDIAEQLQQENTQLRSSVTELEKLKADVERLKELFLVKE